MQLPSERELKQYERWKVAPPSHEEHGVVDTWENPLGERLLAGNCRNWHLSGNLLSCDTDFGPMAQRIPPDFILMGEDEKGLPILKKVLS